MNPTPTTRLPLLPHREGHTLSYRSPAGRLHCTQGISKPCSTFSFLSRWNPNLHGRGYRTRCKRIPFIWVPSFGRIFSKVYPEVSFTVVLPCSCCSSPHTLRLVSL